MFPGGEPEPTASNLNWLGRPERSRPGHRGPLSHRDLRGRELRRLHRRDRRRGGLLRRRSPRPGPLQRPGHPARICDTRIGNPSGSLVGTALSQCQGQAPAADHFLAVTVDGLGGVPSTVGRSSSTSPWSSPQRPGTWTAYPDGLGPAPPLPPTSDSTAGEVVPNRVHRAGRGPTARSTSCRRPVTRTSWSTWPGGSPTTPTPWRPGPSSSRPSPRPGCATRGAAWPTPRRAPGTPSEPGPPWTSPWPGPTPCRPTPPPWWPNVTVTDTTATSHLTVSPAGEARPHRVRPQLDGGPECPQPVVATVGTGGQIELTDFAGFTHVIVDVVGWFITPP